MIVVRTQDRMTLVKPQVIEVDGNIITAAWADCEGELGVYASHKRALEVMDAIEKHVGSMAVEVFTMPDR